MKNSVLKFGVYSLVTALVLFALALFLGDGMSYDIQEVFGYGTMVASLIFVFFGIKHFRNNVNNGKISFGKALRLGLLISLFAAIGFGIVDFIYTTFINPDFAQEFLTVKTAELKESLPPEEFEAQSALLKQQMEDYGSPGFMAALMFVTVMIMGFVISLISALILQRK